MMAELMEQVFLRTGCLGRCSRSVAASHGAAWCQWSGMTGARTQAHTCRSRSRV